MLTGYCLHNLLQKHKTQDIIDSVFLVEC